MDGKTIERIINSIFRRLLANYGPQHWWPAEEPFEVIVGAILTQSTSWTNVEKAITSLRAAGKLSAAAIRNLSDTELARLIHSCGYHNVKAKRLKSFAVWFGDNYSDDLSRLFSVETEKLRAELLAINGIGEETADSVILYAGNKPVFVIDAYTRRIIDRLGLKPTYNNYTNYQDIFTRNLTADTRLFNEYHALLVRLGKEQCRKSPVCAGCCLNQNTAGGMSPDSGRYPCDVTGKGESRAVDSYQ